MVRPARLRQVPYPLHALVVALLEYLQEAHDQARRGEHEHLEVNIDRRAGPDLARRRARQLRVARERHLLATLYSRNPTIRVLSALDLTRRADGHALPHDDVLRRHVLRLPERHLAVDVGRVERGGYAHDDVRRRELVVEARLHGNDVRHLRRPDLVHGRDHAQRELHVRRRAVAHQLELAVGRHEADRARRVELVQPHALVERAVVELHGVPAAVAVVLVDHELVVQPELALGRTGEVCAHEDVPVDVRTQDSAYGTNCELVRGEAGGK